jgi:hypothetical protein
VTRFQKPSHIQTDTHGWPGQAAYDAMQAAIIPADSAARASEAKWGVGRLAHLVSAPTLAAWRRGRAAYNAAIDGNDVAAVQMLAPKIIAALAFMDAEATAAGHAPLAPVVWEFSLPNGTVVGITRTEPEAAALARDQGYLAGRAVSLWTLEQIARVLPSVVHDVKTVFPGAAVERVVRHDEGHAESWVTHGGHDPLFEGAA